MYQPVTGVSPQVLGISPQVLPTTGMITTGTTTLPAPPQAPLPGVLTADEKAFIRAAAAEIRAEATATPACAHGLPTAALAFASDKDASFVTEAQALRKALIVLLSSEVSDSADAPRIAGWSLRSLIDCISRLEDYISSAEMEVLWGDAAVSFAARSTDPTFNYTCPACGESVTVRPIHKLQTVTKVSPDNTQKPDGTAEPQALTPQEVSEAGSKAVSPDELLGKAAVATEEQTPMNELELEKLTASITKAASDTAAATAAATVASILAALGIKPQVASTEPVAVADGINPDMGIPLAHPGKTTAPNSEEGESVKVAPDGGLVNTNDTIPTLSSDEATDVAEAGKKGVNPFPPKDDKDAEDKKDGGKDDDEENKDGTKKKKKKANPFAKSEDESAETVEATDETVAVVEADDETVDELAALASLRGRNGGGVRQSYSPNSPEDRARYIADVVAAQAAKASQIGLDNLSQLPRSDVVRAAREQTAGSSAAAAIAEQPASQPDTNPAFDALAQLFVRSR